MHIAIITEYNPFHMGHEYQLSRLRLMFPDACITAIMGGNFSQRGEPYVTIPYVRAAAALACGADLVVELPFPFSCAPANIFARAGVEVAAKIGADMLAFGSECGDIEILQKTLARLDSEEMRTAVEKEEKRNPTLGKTRAFDKAYKELYGEECSSKPNDILAYEYLRAINNCAYSITPLTVKRIGDFKSGDGGFASATSIRNDMSVNGINALHGNVPTMAEEIYKTAYEKGLFGSDIEKLSSAVMLKLCMLKNTDSIAFSGDGFFRRIGSASLRVKSISELKALCSTKSYTNAEISRRILYALLDVTREDIDAPVHYTRIFAANSRGREAINRVSKIAMITKPSDFKKLSVAALLQYEKNALAERAFALCFDGEYNYLTQTPIMI